MRNVFATDEGIYTATFDSNSGDDFLYIQLWDIRGTSQIWGAKFTNMDTRDSYMCRVSNGNLVLLAIDDADCGNNILL